VNTLWLVIKPNGEHFLLEKEPLEGILAWANGQDVQVREYRFHHLVYPQPKNPS